MTSLWLPRWSHRNPRPAPALPEATTATITHTRAGRRGMAALVTAIAAGLAFVIAAPIALSSQDLVNWAGSPSGLGLGPGWALFVFVALDLAAAVCVGMVVYSAWRGESGGIFGLLVWVFAGVSAFANYRHSIRPDAAPDARWFFPAMSLLGPTLLEVTVRRVRRWVKSTAGRYERPLPHFRLARWILAFPETWRAYVLAVTEGYSRPEEAITAARQWRHTPPPAEPDPVNHRITDQILNEQAGRRNNEGGTDRLDRPPVDSPEDDRSSEPVDDGPPPPPPESPNPDPEPDKEPTGRQYVTPAALDRAYEAYEIALLQGRRMKAPELAPLLGVNEDRARTLRRTKLDPRFKKAHPAVRLVG